MASVTGRGGEVASVIASDACSFGTFPCARGEMSESRDVRIHDIQVADTEAYLVEPAGGGRGSGDALPPLVRHRGAGREPDAVPRRSQQPGARSRDGLDPAAGALPVGRAPRPMPRPMPSASGPRSNAIAPPSTCSRPATMSPRDGSVWSATTSARCMASCWLPTTRESPRS